MVTSLRWSLLFQMLHATVTLLLTRLRVSRGQKFQDQPQASFGLGEAMATLN